MTPAQLLDGLPAVMTGAANVALLALPGLARFRREPEPVSVQEQAGFHLCIAPDTRTAGRHAARDLVEHYEHWLRGEDEPAATAFTAQHFTVAVGGGNTIKNLYHALLSSHLRDVDWLEHVRFFFLEETCDAENWESARDSLVDEFIEPLARKLIVTSGSAALREQLGLGPTASYAEIADHITQMMTFPIDMGAVDTRLALGDRAGAVKAAAGAARTYQRLLRELLGPTMAFHMIISGIGRDGGIGALEPYAEALGNRRPAATALQRSDGAISVTLSRGVLTAAWRIALLIAGSHKLRALGRFEMDDSADFEQTVRETPIRMLREDTAIAERVHIFADDGALLFEEGVFRYQAGGATCEVKSEVREGDESNGIHILLVHGFMGLYSYINLLIRLPRAWQVSALRRGSYAKSLPRDEVFPHYALTLRKMILKDWRAGRPTPICCHSMAGIISDHLLLSVLSDPEDALPEFEQLKPQDQQLIEALRTGGIINIATWAPSDTCHLAMNFKNLKLKRGEDEPLDFSGPGEIYDEDEDGALQLNDAHADGLRATPGILNTMIRFPGTETVVNTMNMAVRFLVGKVDMQKLMKKREAPYGMRILSSRVLQRVSFYGVLKEVDAAMHDPWKYQDLHLKALDAIVKYDIPHLCIVHRHDFMVSANRHVREYEYLLQERMRKEGVSDPGKLQVPVRLVRLGADQDEPSVELIDPHFLILSTSKEGGGNAREVTAAMTGFVHDNAARAARAGRIAPLASVNAWLAKQRRRAG